MKNQQKITNMVGIIFVISIVAIGIYNIFTNSEFWETSITALLTALVAVMFSYLFVQSKNDRVRRNEKIDKLLYKIQDIITEDEFISVDNEEIVRKNLIKHRSVANKILYLEKMSNCDSEIKTNVKELENEFRIFREFYGDHYSDKDYMHKSYKQIYNFIIKIDDLADKIHIQLL